MPKKIQIFEIQNPKNTPLILGCIYAKPTPWEDYSKFLNGCQSGSACPWRVGTCQWGVDGDRHLSYWLDLLGAIRKVERRLNCVNVRSAFSQWEKRRNPSSTWNYMSTRKQQNTPQLPTIKKFAVWVILSNCNNYTFQHPGWWLARMRPENMVPSLPRTLCFKGLKLFVETNWKLNVVEIWRKMTINFYYFHRNSVVADILESRQLFQGPKWKFSLKNTSM